MASLSKLLDPTKPRTPLYFFSHGGPTFMYDDKNTIGEKGAFDKTKDIGLKILNEIKPNFIIIVSAHWESNYKDSVEISISNEENSLGQLENKLIYDFYGFPSFMYKEQFHTKNDISLAKHIQNTLIEGGIDAKLSKRGIDHGVWVPFKVAFSYHKLNDEYYDLNIPLIQISLGQNPNDFEFHSKLGSILDKYRSLNGLVVTSGMSVHNLRDLGLGFSYGNSSLPYVSKFNKLLTNIITNFKGEERLIQLNELKLNDLLYQAHPSLEHFVPIVVATGSSFNTKAKELYNADVGSLGWGIYQFD
ncbi:hypothetical protein WICMUC_002648 [Wickerhamomyces mucosus]|uniref:Extradiol ring-cleavage dioxygenase class III enzyme subunit B domain-containing protein n=1 Tax=Wickerhamomyces mucosus TaxID=1378264 RepID=A0A9P8TE77_9ASCO|nr:hypothetical protein WICMUC_002648 [Wickerhamomyces mucosus]